MTAITSLLFGSAHFFESLFKGRYLKFFIASILAGGLYLYLDYSLTEWERAGSEELNAVSSGSYATVASGWMKSFVRTFLLEGSKFLLLIVLSPFLAVLSARVEDNLSVEEVGSGVLMVFKQLIRCILIVIVALIVEWIALALWWLISSVLPFGADLDSYVAATIGLFFIGFTFIDYPLDRRAYGIGASWRFSKKHVLLLICVGLIFNGLLMIPYFGAFVAPVIVTIISTAAFVRLSRNITTE